MKLYLLSELDLEVLFKTAYHDGIIAQLNCDPKNFKAAEFPAKEFMEENESLIELHHSFNKYSTLKTATALNEIEKESI